MNYNYWKVKTVNGTVYVKTRRFYTKTADFEHIVNSKVEKVEIVYTPLRKFKKAIDK